MAKFSLDIKAERQKRGWTVRQLAQKLKTEVATIYRWESKKANPTAFFIFQIIDLFDIPCRIRKPEDIKHQRKTRNWSQRKLAKYINAKQASVSMWETGNVIRITAHLLD